MSTFAGSSALVKLYVAEDGGDTVAALADVLVSQVVRVEVPAALWRMQRLGRADTSAARLAVDDFVADYSGTASAPARFAVVGLTDAVLADAAGLTGVHGLRAYDAVQLACARAAARTDDRVRTFAAFDRHLRGAAATEGFVVVP